MFNLFEKRVDLRIDLDTRCNFKCRYCDNSDLPISSKVSIPINEIDTLFQNAEKKCWSLFLSCAGEPLLNPQLEQILNSLSINVKTPDVSMVTNGLLLNQANRKIILDSSIDRIFVSMDSLSPEIYTSWCGVSTTQFQKVFDSIEAFAEERLLSKKPPHLIVTAIAMKDTLDGLPEIARWLKKIKASAFNIQWLNHMGHEDLKQQQLSLEDPLVLKKVKQVLEEVADILKGSGVLLDYPRTISKEKIWSVFQNSKLWRNRFYYFRDAVSKWTASRRHLPCRFVTNTYYLWPDGHLKGCPADAIETENIFNGISSLEKEIVKVEQFFSKKDNTLDACRDCPINS